MGETRSCPEDANYSYRHCAHFRTDGSQCAIAKSADTTCWFFICNVNDCPNNDSGHCSEDVSIEGFVISNKCPKANRKEI